MYKRYLFSYHFHILIALSGCDCLFMENMKLSFTEKKMIMKTMTDFTWAPPF